MTENEAMDLDKLIVDANALAIEKETLARIFRGFIDYGNPKSTITSYAEKAQKEAEQYEQVAKLFEELKQYRAIGTIEEFKALKEKSVAKKPEVDEFDYGEGFVCGECESFLHYVDDDDEHIRTNYCCHCGTRIDWSE